MPPWWVTAGIAAGALLTLTDWPPEWAVRHRRQRSQAAIDAAFDELERRMETHETHRRTIPSCPDPAHTDNDAG